jgi:hypothetical protein
VPPTIPPTFGPSPLEEPGLSVVVAPDTAFLTQLAEAQVLQSPMAVTQSSSDLQFGHTGAPGGHCTQRLKRE